MTAFVINLLLIYGQQPLDIIIVDLAAAQEKILEATLLFFYNTITLYIKAALRLLKHLP